VDHVRGSVRGLNRPYGTLLNSRRSYPPIKWVGYSRVVPTARVLVGDNVFGETKKNVLRCFDTATSSIVIQINWVRRSIG